MPIIQRGNLISIFQNRAKNKPQELAYLFLKDGKQETARINNNELDQRACAIAATLQSNKIFSERIILLYPPGIDFIAAFMGCLYAGAIAVPVHCPKLKDFENASASLTAIADDAGIMGILTTTEYVKKITDIFPLKHLRRKLLFITDTTTLLLDHSNTYQPPTIKSDTIAYLQYTSGSATTPKAAIIRHENLTHSLKQTIAAWHYSSESITVTWAPHSHVYGLICGLLIPLYHGSPAVLIPPETFIRRPGCWLETITQYHATHSGCPNFGYQLCIDKITHEELMNLNLKSWKIAVNGGEVIQPETLLKFAEKFQPAHFSLKRFCAAYGMSEMTGTIAVSAYEKQPNFYNLTDEGLRNHKVVFANSAVPQRTFAGCGQVLPGLQAIIVNPETLSRAPRGTIGEIWLTGKSLVSHYWQYKKETEKVFDLTLSGSKKKYFRTGDLGFITKKEICLTGRLKDLIIIYGKKYYPGDLEVTVSHALQNLPVVNQRVVFASPIEGKERIIFLQEIQESPSNATCNQIIQTIANALIKRFAINPHCIVLIKAHSLPKTNSGKLQRKLCQQQFLAGELSIIAKRVTAVSAITQKENHSRSAFSTIASTFPARLQGDFTKMISSVLNIKPHEINLTAPISHYAFDSINIIQLIALLNETYGLNITPDRLYEYVTLSDFLNDLLSQNAEELSRYYQMPIYKNSQFTDKKTDFLALPETDHSRQIAIIGMNAILPNAANLTLFWENLLNNIDAIKKIPEERWPRENDAINNGTEKTKWGGFIDGIKQFDAAFFSISPREAELMDPQHRLFLQVAWGAIENAGYATQALATLRVGVFVGVFNNDYAELLKANNITDAYTTTGITHSVLANRVSYLLNLHGPSEAIDTACSSSLVAIHHAVQAIQHGDCELAIVGGSNALLTPTAYQAASAAGMLSEEGKCKTFDKNANGYVRAEGIAAIILKPLDLAEKDGDLIYGIIKGTAVNHGGQVNSLTAPNPHAQAEVIIAACSRAGVPLNSINYIEAHGTGTALGDPIEINGLKKAFASLIDPALPHKINYCGLGSVKSNIGHLEAAAGIVGVLKVLLAMQHQYLPGNLHFNELNPYIDLKESPFYIVSQGKPWPRLLNSADSEIPRRAGISSFGFGGTNAHIILEEPPFYAENDLPRQNALPCLIALSAKTELALQQRIQDLYDWLSKQVNEPSIEAMSYTLNAGRDHFPKRCIFLINNISELRDTLHQVLAGNMPENYVINISESNKDRIRPIFNELFAKITGEIHSPDSLPLHEYKNKLLALGNFYTEGYELNWEQLHLGKKQRIALPTYPFAKDNYWIPEKKLADPLSLNPTNHDSSKISIPLRIQQDVSQYVSNLLKIPASLINITKTLSEIGFDSITFKELALQLEKHYDVNLNPAIFFTYTSIQKICRHLFEAHTEKVTLKYDVYQKIVSQEEPVTSYSQTLAHSATSESVAIIGMYGYFPQSDNLHDFWKNLENGHDFITEIPPERCYWQEYDIDTQMTSNTANPKWGGFLKDIAAFDADFFNISAREASLMDPQQRLLLEVAWKTIEDAGHDPLTLSGQPVGLFVGVEFSDYQMLIRMQQKILHGHVATGNSHAILANRISYFLDLNGPSEAIDTACSSSLVALHRAVNSLRQGECTVAIAGGVSLMIDPFTLVTTAQLRVLSPDGRCKAFDKSANGYVKGEGVATVMLKPLSQAKKDNDFIYGIIKSSVVNHGGKAQSLTAPNASAQTRLVIDAYTQANINPNTVTYIETHGTGTELGDPIEIEGLKAAFDTLINRPPNNTKAFCGLGSLKTQIGHLEPASGIAGVIKVLLAMQHEKIPGNLHLNTVNPYIKLTESPFYLLGKTQDWVRLRDSNGFIIPFRAGISSFGFGGTNAHVVLEEAPSQEKKTALYKPFYLFTLSAKREQSLRQKIVDLYTWLVTAPSSTSLENLSFTLNAGRAHFTTRSAIVATSLTELSQTLLALTTGQSPDNCILNTTPNNTIHDAHFAELYQATMKQIKQANKLSAMDYRDQLLTLANLYTQGYKIEWDKLHEGETKKRLAGLPAYPFIKQRYWFDKEWEVIAAPTTAPQLNTLTSPATATITHLHDFTLAYLKNVFATKLRLTPEQIDADVTYEDFGVDSLLGLEIITQLEQEFGTLSKTLLYEKNRLQELANYLQKNFSNVLQSLYQQKGFSSSQSTPPLKSFAAKASVMNTHRSINSIGDDIAIIGLSGTFPMAANTRQLWKNLVEGRHCITEIPAERWDYRDYPVQVGEKTQFYKHGGFIPDVDKFDPLFFKIAPREAAMMDPQERLFMQSAWTTLEDAGYTRDRLEKKTNNNVGVFAGVTYNFYPLFIAEEWTKGHRPPLDIQLFSVANRISYFLNLTGPSYIVDTACSSSLAAIHLACESLQRGECIMALAGGVNLSLHPAKYHFLGSFGLLSPEGRCASFAAGGAGYVPAEGVGSVLLKPLSLALQDQDSIYGIIKASSMNHGGKTSGYTVPNPKAQTELIKNTLLKAKINPRSISYIEAHGTGTALGDPIEIRGLQDAFSQFTQDKQFCAIGSVKSNIGHLESAAGISQLAKVLLQFQHRKLVPSLHADTLNPYIDFAATPFFVQKELSDWQPNQGYPRRAGISSFGAGGTNVHLIVEEFASPPTQHAINVSNKPFIFLLSALSSERLQEYIKNMDDFITAKKINHPETAQLDSWLMGICRILQTSRESMPARLAIMTATSNELLDKIKKCSTKINADYSVWLNHSAAIKKIAEDNLDELMRALHYEELIKLWIDGTQIPWERLYPLQSLQHMNLPTYPFTKRRCWITTEEEKPAFIQQNGPQCTTALAESANEWLYCTRWQPQSLDKKTIATNQTEKGFWLIFSDKELGFVLQNKLGKENCIYCFTGLGYEKLSDSIFYLDPECPDDYNQLLTCLTVEMKINLRGMLYLWALPTYFIGSPYTNLLTLSKTHEISHQLLYLFQTLAHQSWQQPVPFWLITRNSQSIAENESIQLWQHHLGSLARIFAAEQTQYQTVLIDLDSRKSLQQEATLLAAELDSFQPQENHIAYRKGQRYVNRLLPYTQLQVKTWHPPEAVLITGGLGALGIEVATWLVKQGTKHFLLTGNTVLPARLQWTDVSEPPIREKIQHLLQLEQLGAKVSYFAVDAADKPAMQQAISQTEEAWKKPINGVFHLAGITTDSITLENTSKELLQKVLAPKIQGALVLHDLFKKPGLNCFVLFSSIAALPYFGMKGLGAYAMANEFLSGLAAFRRSQGLSAISINWAAWADKGMSFKYDHSAFLEAVGMSAIPLSLGVGILHYLLTLQPVNIIVFKITWEKFLRINVETKKLPFFSYFAKQYLSENINNAVVTLDHSQTTQLVTDTLAQLLKLSTEEIDPDVPYQDYGLDSISGVHFIAQLHLHVPDRVSPMDLYRYPTVNQLVDYLMQQQLSQMTSTLCHKEEILLETINQLNAAEISQLIEDELAELEP